MRLQRARREVTCTSARVRTKLTSPVTQASTVVQSLYYFAVLYSSAHGIFLSAASTLCISGNFTAQHKWHAALLAYSTFSRVDRYQMAPTGSSHVNATLGILCAAGGVMGYLKKKSMPSLVAGIAIGAAYGASAYVINTGDPATGHLFGLVSSLVLSGAMGSRFASSRKVLPAGAMAAAGALGAIYNFQKYQEWTS